VDDQSGQHSLSPPARVGLGLFKIADDNRLRATTAREQQLVELMSRSKEAASGSIVDAMVYQDDLNTARANIRELRKAGETKHCAVEATPAPR
jgi:hypothetical protein